MVAWQTSPQGNCLTGTMVPCSRSSADTEEVPTTVARQDAESSSTMPYSVLQDGLYQARCSFGHSCAITNRPLTTGRVPIRQSVVANPGPFTRVRHSILPIHTGSYQALFFNPCSNRTLQSLRKDHYPTKFFRPRRSFTIRCDLAYKHGPNGMVFLPYHIPASPTFAINSGPSTQNRSPIISPSNPSENFKTPSKVQSSTVKTNMPHLSASSVRVSTMNPSRKHSKTRPFSNHYPMNHPQL